MLKHALVILVAVVFLVAFQVQAQEKAQGIEKWQADTLILIEKGAKERCPETPDSVVIKAKMPDLREYYIEIKETPISKDDLKKKESEVFRAKALEMKNEFLKAAYIFIRYKCHYQAGECYFKAEKYIEAGNEYAMAKEYSKAAESYFAASKEFDRNYGECDKYRVNAADNYVKAQQYLEAAGIYAALMLKFQELYTCNFCSCHDCARYEPEQCNKFFLKMVYFGSKAGVSYKKSKCFDEAIKCFQNAGDFAAAADIYKQQLRYDVAASNYERADALIEAARMHVMAGYKKSAKIVCIKLMEQRCSKNFEQAVKYLSE